MVWQDMPSMYWEDPYTGAQPGDIAYRTPPEKAQFEHELQRLIEVILMHADSSRAKLYTRIH
jgi:hypothetical protein